MGKDSMSIHIRSDDVVVIVGKRRSGKTYFLRQLVQPFKRRIIWDYNWEHGDLGYVVHFPNQIKDALLRGLSHIVFQPNDKTPEAFDAFLKMADCPNTLIVIEELERYAYNKIIPPNLRPIIDTGRHRGQGLVVTARRIKRLHQDIPANADHIFIFQTHKPEDLDHLREWVGEEVYQLRTLPQWHFIHYDNSEGSTVVRKPV